MSVSISPGKKKLNRADSKKCRNLLNKIAFSKYSDPFQNPLDWKYLNLMDYPSVIKNPMDLGTIRSNLNSQLYKTVNEFASDMRLIWNNCIKYNDKSYSVHDDAIMLSNIFEKEFQEMLAKIHQRNETMINDQQKKRKRNWKSNRNETNVELQLPPKKRSKSNSCSIPALISISSNVSNDNEQSLNMIQNEIKSEEEPAQFSSMPPLEIMNEPKYKYVQGKLQSLMNTFPTKMEIAKQSRTVLNNICQINHSLSTSASFHDYSSLNRNFIESKEMCLSLKLQIEKSHENNCQQLLKNIEQCKIHYNDKIKAQSNVQKSEKSLEENLEKINDLKKDLLSVQELRFILKTENNENIDYYREKEDVWSAWQRSVEQFKEVNQDMQLIVDHEMHIKLDDILNEIENKLHEKYGELLFAWKEWTNADVISWMEMSMNAVNVGNYRMFQPSTVKCLCSMIDRKCITGKDMHLVNKLLLVDLLSVEEIDWLLMKIKSDLLDNEERENVMNDDNNSEKNMSGFSRNVSSVFRGEFSVDININCNGDEHLHCKFCAERNLDAICLPCAHVCLCWECYLIEKEEINMKCPMCKMQCSDIRQFQIL